MSRRTAGELTFSATLERDKDGTWWYVHVPAAVREALREHAKRGITPVRVTVGSSAWGGSILPWADGSGQISIKASVRAREGLELGASLRVTVTPR